MKKLLTVLAAASMIAFAGGNLAEAKSPILGAAKATPMSKAATSKVVGKGSTSQYYAYYGTYFTAYALAYGAVGFYYDAAGDSSTAAAYYYYAYYYSYYGSVYYYYAYYYA